MNTSSTTATHSPAAAPARFAATRWTLVLGARGQSAEAQTALGTLCEDYYAPVLHFIRASSRDEDTARDLTQEFFAQLLRGHRLDRVDRAQGRFRSYLLGAVKHFLAEHRRRARAIKRGGREAPVPLEGVRGAETTTGLPLSDPLSHVSDAFFDRQWAVTLVDRAVAVLAAENAAAGGTEQFEALRPWLVGEVTSVSQADVARRLGLSEGATKVLVHRLRKRIRELVKGEIQQTVSDPTQVQQELHYLVEVLAQSP